MEFFEVLANLSPKCNSSNWNTPVTMHNDDGEVIV